MLFVMKSSMTSSISEPKKHKLKRKGSLHLCILQDDSSSANLDHANDEMAEEEAPIVDHTRRRTASFHSDKDDDDLEASQSHYDDEDNFMDLEASESSHVGDDDDADGFARSTMSRSMPAQYCHPSPGLRRNKRTRLRAARDSLSQSWTDRYLRLSGSKASHHKPNDVSSSSSTTTSSKRRSSLPFTIGESDCNHGMSMSLQHHPMTTSSSSTTKRRSSTTFVPSLNTVNPYGGNVHSSYYGSSGLDPMSASMPVRPVSSYHITKDKENIDTEHKLHTMTNHQRRMSQSMTTLTYSQARALRQKQRKSGSSNNRLHQFDVPTTFQQQQQKKNQQSRWKVIFMTLLALILSSILFGCYYHSTHSTDRAHAQPFWHKLTGKTKTDIQRYQHLVDKLVAAGVDKSSLYDIHSDAYTALQWLFKSSSGSSFYKNAEFDLEAAPPSTLLERFALVTLYYATHISSAKDRQQQQQQQEEGASAPVVPVKW
jgi:hypothetical protein